MRTLFFTLLLSVLGINRAVYAQDKIAAGAKSYISVSTGPSFASGNFAATSTGALNNWDNKAGFAKAGVTISAEGAYYLWKNIGIAGTVTFSGHGKLSSSDAAILGNSYTDAFDVDESTVMTSGNYKAMTFLAGPQYSFVLNKLTVDVRFMAGAVKSLSTPVITVLLEDQAGATFTQQRSTASAFAWQAGAGLRYDLGNSFGLLFRADYLQSQGIRIDNTNRQNKAGRLVTKQPMAWTTTTIGIYYSF